MAGAVPSRPVVIRFRLLYAAGWCLALLTSACQHEPQPGATPAAAPGPYSVSIITPQWRELARTLTVTGDLLADEEVLVSAKVAGRVQAVHLDFGDAAPGGALLLEVDPTDYALARQESALALAQALAELGLEELGDGAFDPDATPAVRKALAVRDNVEQRRARAERLAAERPPVISEEELTNARAALEVAEAEVEVARLAARSAFAQAQLLDARLRSAAQRLADTAHRAPSADPAAEFLVAERMVAAGDYVAVGAPLFRLVDGDPLRLRARVPERHLDELALGQAAEVSVEASGRGFGGVVERLAPEIERNTRTFIAELRVPNADRVLLPGGFASAVLHVGADRVLMLPESCVRRFAGVHKILLVRDGLIEERRVELGGSAGDWIEVRSGVAETDLVVVAPDPALVTGSAVTPLAAEDARAGAR